MPHQDLREWLAEARRSDEIRQVNGAHWDLEMAAVMELAARDKSRRRALLFDDIVGYPHGHRVLLDALGALPRVALTLGLDPEISRLDFTQALRERLRNLRLIPPREVTSGPVLENVQEGAAVDLFSLPAPKYHTLDGGRYIGTGSVTISRDPTNGWVNFGTYRIMIHDAQTLSFHVSPGHHAWIHREQVFAQGQPLHVAVSFGHHPLLLMAGSAELPYGMSEYDWAGGMRGEPIEVLKGPYTGLPLPAGSEIVAEGISYPDEERTEGPFGEWTGYYASSSRPLPVIKVKTLMHRHDPIILGVPQLRPSRAPTFYHWLQREALLWEALEKAGVPDVKAVHCHDVGGRFLSIIAIRQRYPGHARQAAHIATQCNAGAYMGRYTIVVDDDIDIYDTDEVLWAVCTRSDPERSIEIMSRCWSGPLDPAIRPEEKGFNSRAIIDACKPWEWLSQFPIATEMPRDLLTAAAQKFGDQLV